jgi:hypothetical protein
MAEPGSIGAFWIIRQFASLILLIKRLIKWSSRPFETSTLSDFLGNFLSNVTTNDTTHKWNCLTLINQALFSKFGN